MEFAISQASDTGLASASTPLGVALLSANSVTIAYGQTTTLSSAGGFKAVNWCGGCPGVAQVYAGTLQNAFIAPDHNSFELGWNAGPTATIVAPVVQGS